MSDTHIPDGFIHFAGKRFFSAVTVADSRTRIREYISPFVSHRDRQLNYLNLSSVRSLYAGPCYS